MADRAGTESLKTAIVASSSYPRNDRWLQADNYETFLISPYRMMARNATDTGWLRWTANRNPDWLGLYAGAPILAGSAFII